MVLKPNQEFELTNNYKKLHAKDSTGWKMDVSGFKTVYKGTYSFEVINIDSKMRKIKKKEVKNEEEGEEITDEKKEVKE